MQGLCIYTHCAAVAPQFARNREPDRQSSNGTHSPWTHRRQPLKNRYRTNAEKLSDPRILFGLQVRRIRRAKGWTQEELADLCDLDRSYVGGIERGERNIALINIYKLAGALEVSPAEFFPEDKS